VSPSSKTIYSAAAAFEGAAGFPLAPAATGAASI